MMKRPFWLFAPLLIFLATILGLSLKLFLKTEASKPSFHLGKTVPKLQFQTTLPADFAFPSPPYTAPFVLLNLFASWCRNCKYEHELLMQLRTIPHLRIYGIAWHDTLTDVKEMLVASGNPYHGIGLDMQGEAVISLGVAGIPETFLLDKEGKILFFWQGPLTEVQKKEILSLITPSQKE